MAPSGKVHLKVRHGQVQVYVGSLGNICSMPASASKNGKNVRYFYYTVMSYTVRTCQTLEHHQNELRQTLELVAMFVCKIDCSLQCGLFRECFVQLTVCLGDLHMLSCWFGCCKQLTDFLFLSRLFNIGG